MGMERPNRVLRGACARKMRMYSSATEEGLRSREKQSDSKNRMRGEDPPRPCPHRPEDGHLPPDASRASQGGVEGEPATPAAPPGARSPSPTTSPSRIPHGAPHLRQASTPGDDGGERLLSGLCFTSRWSRSVSNRSWPPRRKEVDLPWGQSPWPGPLLQGSPFPAWGCSASSPRGGPRSPPAGNRPPGPTGVESAPGSPRW